MFIQIGLSPNSHFVNNLLELNEYGEIVTNDRCETSVSGIFAGGDVSSVPHKQIIVSMGHGTNAKHISGIFDTVEVIVAEKSEDKVKIKL